MLKKYGNKRMRESVEGKMQQGERGRRRGWRAGGKRRALSKISNWRQIANGSMPRGSHVDEK